MLAGIKVPRRVAPADHGNVLNNWLLCVYNSTASASTLKKVVTSVWNNWQEVFFRRTSSEVKPLSMSHSLSSFLLFPGGPLNSGSLNWGKSLIQDQTTRKWELWMLLRPFGTAGLNPSWAWWGSGVLLRQGSLLQKRWRNEVGEDGDAA